MSRRIGIGNLSAADLPTLRKLRAMFLKASKTSNFVSSIFQQGMAKFLDKLIAQVEAK